MITIIRAFLLLGLLSLCSQLFADDTDIYLDTDATRANPPYLMLMVDYRPSVVSTMCNSLTACVPKMSENGFAKLCKLFAGGTEATCRMYYKDVIAGGTLTGQGTGL